jgi:hypothetical protein
MDLGRLRGCLLIDGHICAVQGRFVGIFIRLFLLNNFRCLCVHFLVTTVNILYGNRNKMFLCATVREMSTSRALSRPRN